MKRNICRDFIVARKFRYIQVVYSRISRISFGAYLWNVDILIIIILGISSL